jgi:ABC-type branched-subunit amino acid transport system ATPase component
MIVEEIFRAIETMVSEGMSILLVEQNAYRAL